MQIYERQCVRLEAMEAKARRRPVQERKANKKPRVELKERTHFTRNTKKEWMPCHVMNQACPPTYGTPFAHATILGCIILSLVLHYIIHTPDFAWSAAHF